MKLIDMPKDSEGKILSEYDGRVSALGLHRGALFLVVKNDSSNPLIIKIKNSKYAIGREVAARIEVQ